MSANSAPDGPFDLVVIGAGINGIGVARDAAGRGLKVLVCDKDDLGAHTSSTSSKLVHGGLRYLEYYEFRLVGESLAERESMLTIAPHIVWPLEFVMPHVPELRPAWMIRAGLFLYDHLARRTRLPGSRGVRLDRTPYGAGLNPGFRNGFVYSDCWVDDARLVVLNARSAADHGATVLPRHACIAARRHEEGWSVDLRGADGRLRTVATRALVNVGGPWVKALLDGALAAPTKANVKLVKGSHIVVPKVHPGAHACILQNTDKRVIFLLPYEGEFTLIGTTDVPLAGPDDEVACTPDEVEYLCRAVNRYLARPIGPREVVWTFAGVRPLYDDGKSDPSAITRDYVIELDVAQPRAPLLSVFGGKLTTYRKLGEAVLDRLRPSFPHMRGGWTATEPLPGGDMPGADFEALMAALASEYPKLELGLLHAIARRHGTRTRKVMGDARTAEDLGRHFGHTLYEREVDLLVREEWASTAEDVLWRRTKCGLHLTPAQRESFGRWMAAR